MDKLMKYRNYQGSVEISIADGVLHGQILFIRDLVTYEAETVPELQAAFGEAVDDYLETCEEVGKDPDKPCSGTFNVRVGPGLHRRALMTSMNLGQSLNEFVTHWVDYGVRHYGDELFEVHHHHHHEVVANFEFPVIPAKTEENLWLLQ